MENRASQRRFCILDLPDKFYHDIRYQDVFRMTPGKLPDFFRSANDGNRGRIKECFHTMALKRVQLSDLTEDF